MGFMAGWVSLEGPLPGTEKKRFREAVRQVTAPYPWPLQWEARPHCILALAQFARMWQGDRMVCTPGEATMALGVQWKPLDTAPGATLHLARAIGEGRGLSGNPFDYFLAARVQDQPRQLVLASDPLGIVPLYYIHHGRRVLFSTHQRLFRHLLSGPEAAMDILAVQEYLLIGHVLGERTFHRGVSALPAGGLLEAGPGKWRLKRRPVPLSAETGARFRHAMDAAWSLLDLMEHKARHYLSLADRPLAGLLSGGLDSRLLAALFARQGALHRSFTTQQQTRMDGRLISEKKIAREVARHLGLKNRFVAPRYRTHRTLGSRAARLDTTTWFHDWAFHLADSLPVDRFILCDGLLGDILLRALYRSPELHACVLQGDRTRARDLFMDRYVQGFNPYTRGLGPWLEVLRHGAWGGLEERLREEIHVQLHGEPAEDFVTAFLIRNRTRRGITPLPLFLFGARAQPILPYADPEFVKLALAVPWVWKRDFSLFQAMLERLSPGLWKIPSTNTRDRKALCPYLRDSVYQLSLSGRLRKAWKKRRMLPAPGPLAREWFREELLQVVDKGSREAWKRWGFFLDRIAMVDDYFS